MRHDSFVERLVHHACLRKQATTILVTQIYAGPKKSPRIKILSNGPLTPSPFRSQLLQPQSACPARAPYEETPIFLAQLAIFIPQWIRLSISAGFDTRQLFRAVCLSYLAHVRPFKFYSKPPSRLPYLCAYYCYSNAFVNTNSMPASMSLLRHHVLARACMHRHILRRPTNSNIRPLAVSAVRRCDRAACHFPTGNVHGAAFFG